MPDRFSQPRGRQVTSGRSRELCQWQLQNVRPDIAERTTFPGRLKVSGLLQIDGLGALAALVGLGLEGHAHALVEGADARALHRRDVHEHILAALVRRDEAKALRLVEKFDSSVLPHARSPFPR